MKNENELPLRLGVGIALLNHEIKVFVGKRIDNPANSWQMPQGGVDKNEDLLQAAKRELKEETNIKTIAVIKELNGWLTYELPKNLLGKIWNGKYRGQKQKWFIMKFMGKIEEINVKDLSKEFLDNLNKDIRDKLTQKDISDNERYILNHKLDVLKEIRV